jgi:ribosomal protein L35AE/L33A
MKNLLGFLLIGLISGVVAVYAENVSVVAETGEFVSVATAATTAANAAASVTTGTVAQVSGATNVVSTTFTPAHAGQLLIGTVSNVVYVAKGVSTNDWVLISNAE